MSIDKRLQARRDARIALGEVGILVNNQNDSLCFGVFEDGFECNLDRGERCSCGAIAKYLAVRDIANEIERPAAYVRSQLNKWTKLKHDLDVDIELNGFDSSELLKRCTIEKLDLNNLLNAKRKKQIQDYAKLKRLVK